MGGHDSQKLLPRRGIHLLSGARQTSGALQNQHSNRKRRWGSRDSSRTVASRRSATDGLGDFWKAEVGHFSKAPKVEADLNMKQRALEKLAPAKGTMRRYEPLGDLLEFLSRLLITFISRAGSSFPLLPQIARCSYPKSKQASRPEKHQIDNAEQRGTFCLFNYLRQSPILRFDFQ